MQNRYSGDIGDYVKLALLRAISKGRRLGVAWFLYPDEGHNFDGRHTTYLSNPATWRHLDPTLFDLLRNVVQGERSVQTLQRAFSEEACFAAELVPAEPAVAKRSSARMHWFERNLQHLNGCDFVFADPDNGLVGDEDWRRKVLSFGKQMPLSEARAFSAGRCAVIYHHNSRFKGGHDAEVDRWIQALDMPTIAVRATAYSCRTFFVINPDAQIVDRTRRFCCRWKNHKVRLHVSSRG
jgi:hypothetical protein